MEYDAIAYTDGSYKNDIFTYGLILFDVKNKIAYKANGKFNDVNWVKMQNIAGEIMGVIKSIKICEKYNFKSVLIFHDYEGLSKWPDNEWKTKNEYTELYRVFIQNSRENIKINFQWVKSHSNNKYNNIADKLANDAYKNTEIVKILI